MSIGVVLLIVGILGLLVGWKKRPTRQVNAKQNSVAIGGDNNAPVTILTNSSAKDGGEISLFWTVWNVVCGLASILGLIIAIWPPK